MGGAEWLCVVSVPPFGSKSILSIDRGPRVVRMMSETALAAAMFANCAFLPVSRFVLVFRMVTGICMVPYLLLKGPTRLYCSATQLSGAL